MPKITFVGAGSDEKESALREAAQAAISQIKGPEAG